MTTTEEYLGRLIDREFAKRPFTVKDVVKRFVTIRDGEVVIGRFPSRREAEVGGETVMVELPSEFELLMDATVNILQDDKLDDDGRPFFIHSSPPRHRETFDDGSYMDIDDFEAATWFHRDIATPEQLIAYGEWLTRLGQETI